MKAETMKKTGKLKWILFLAAVWTLAAFGLLSQAADSGSPSVSLEVSAVFGEAGRLGSHGPVNVRLYNQMEKPFEGSVCITTIETKQERQSEIYEYVYPVSLALAETKSFQYYVPLGQKSNELYVALRDQDGAKLGEEKLQFDVSRETGSLLIGALSGNMEEIRYLDGVSLNYGMVRSRLLELDAGSFPSDSRGLDLLDILIINDYRTGRLSEQQQNAVWQWVQGGGTLLFGTGMRVADTLGPFTEDLVEVPYDPPVMETVNMGVEYAENSPGDSTVELVCANLSIPGGDELIASDEIPILTTVKRGNGKIGIFSFDLGDMREFVEENPTFPENVLTSVLGEDRMRNLYYYSAYGNEQEYWNAQSLVNTGNADRLPNLGLYGGVIIFYIVVAGPGIYLILRKMDQRRYYGMVLTIFALVSSAAVYLIGTGTRFQTEFFTYASIRDVSGDGVAETVFLNIRTPDSRPYSVTMSPGYQVSPITKSNRYEEETTVSFDKNETGNMSIRYGEEGTTISARRSMAFESRFFKMTRKTENTGQQGITSDLTYFDNTISGTITNHYPFSLEQAALLLYGQVVPIGRMEPGETIELGEGSLLTYPVDMTYILADQLAGGNEYRTADVSDQEYLRAVERTSLYSYYISRYYTEYTPEARVIAFGPENRMEDAFADQGKAADGMILYTSRVELDSEQNGRIYRNGLMRRPEMTTGTGTYYAGYGTIYGTDPVVLEYFLGSDIEVEKLSFIPVSEPFLDNTKYYYMKRFRGAVYFYNYNTKIYDQVDLEKQDFNEEELKEYLSPSNNLMVKYVSEEGEAGASSVLPLLMVTGRER